MTPPKTPHFARLLHIGHLSVTWVLESAGVNVSTLCSRTDKTWTTTTNRDEESASVKDLEDLGSDSSADDWSKGTVAGTQRQHARLINASCNAFFLRRGLDSNFHASLHSLPSEMCELE